MQPAIHYKMQIYQCIFLFCTTVKSILLKNSRVLNINNVKIINRTVNIAITPLMLLWYL